MLTITNRKAFNINLKEENTKPLYKNIVEL